jgi:F-box and WD-40 domain protein CDC4
LILIVFAVRLDLERNQVYSSSMDHAVRIWDLRTGDCRHVLKQHDSLVGLLSFSESYLVSAGADSALCVWNPITGELYHHLLMEGAAITAFQHDDVKVLGGSGSKGARLWDIRSGTPFRDILPDVTGVWKVAFSGRWCVAAKHVGDETFIDTWDFGKEAEEATGLGSGSSDLVGLNQRISARL